MSEKATMFLSQSTAQTLLKRTAKHAWQEHWLGGAIKGDPSAAMIRGQVVEAFLFGKGLDRLQVLDFKDYKKDAAKEAKEAALAAGKTPVLIEDYNYYKASAEISRKQLAKRGINFDGVSIETQVKIEWVDPATGCPCKAKLDGLVVGENGFVIYELKSTSDANPGLRERNVSDQGQDLQAATYFEAVEQKYPHLAGRGKFFWLFCEPDPPNEILVARPSGQTIEFGGAKWNKAKAIWADCLKTGVFPGYTEEVLEFRPMAWEQQEAFENEMTSGRDILEALK